ncbi:stimulated by retinoic acid gene 8 protein homolog isoform X3 [Tachysurus fulvidraco]|uniref:stimulated by retinoic acid gene 8 protein homolog isoform X3 n=1 Tax=Tachysurus fulvidraco TaxID=1234273 RepID=UPI001FEED541|nr:stimulated by retinoic acid gene 8 protein homolog isoform X3 [Tachysurus fulvidraco]
MLQTLKMTRQKERSMSCIGQEKQEDEGEQQTVRRRTLQTGHRDTLAGLFEELKNMVCPSSQSNHNCKASYNKRSPAKWKILDHAMGFLLEKEAYLSKLLALKEDYVDDDGGPKSLEDMREQYRSLYSKQSTLHISSHSCTDCVPVVAEDHESSEVVSTDEETDAQSQSSETSVPNIQEFEGETIELLLRSGVLSPDQTGLPVVSEAISGLWSSLPPERREEAQQHALDQRSASWESQTEISASHLTSLDPSASYTVEEDLLQDAYDVVQRDMDAASVNRPAVLPSCDYEKLKQIYKDISGFIWNHVAQDQELPQLERAEFQDLSQASEYEDLLMCSESFDDDF